MFAKRMFLVKLHDLYRGLEGSKVSFIGFEISKTVWSNQIQCIWTDLDSAYDNDKTAYNLSKNEKNIAQKIKVL